MKIRSLLLGSVAAAGLSTSAFAADLGVVLTSLDVCDSLGIKHLSVQTDDNCMKIDGLSYEFTWGDFELIGVSADLNPAMLDMSPGGSGGVAFDPNGIDELVLYTEPGLLFADAIIVPSDSYDDISDWSIEAYFESGPLFGDELGLLPATMLIGEATDLWDSMMPIEPEAGNNWPIIRHGIAHEADGRVWGGSLLDTSPAGIGPVLQVS